MEAVFVFIGTAALIGLVAGGSVHVTSRTICNLLQITPEDEKKLQDSRPAIRSAADFRHQRLQNRELELEQQRQQLEQQSIPSADWNDKWSPASDPYARGGYLAAQTIFEDDEDSSDV